MKRVNQRMMLVLPPTVLLILFLLYLNTRSAVKTMIVSLAVPLSAVGAVWLHYPLGYNISGGVWTLFGIGLGPVTPSVAASRTPTTTTPPNSKLA